MTINLYIFGLILQHYLMERLLDIWIIVEKSIDQFKNQKFNSSIFSKKSEFETMAQYLLENLENTVNPIMTGKDKAFNSEQLKSKLSNYEYHENKIGNLEVDYIKLCNQNKHGIVLCLDTELTKWCEINHKLYYNCPNLTSYVLESPSGRLSKDTMLTFNLKYAIEIIPHTL